MSQIKYANNVILNGKSTGYGGKFVGVAEEHEFLSLCLPVSDNKSLAIFSGIKTLTCV